MNYMSIKLFSKKEKKSKKGKKKEKESEVVIRAPEPAGEVSTTHVFSPKHHTGCGAGSRGRLEII